MFLGFLRRPKSRVAVVTATTAKDRFLRHFLAELRWAIEVQGRCELRGCMHIRGDHYPVGAGGPTLEVDGEKLVVTFHVSGREAIVVTARIPQRAEERQFAAPLAREVVAEAVAQQWYRPLILTEDYELVS